MLSDYIKFFLFCILQSDIMGEKVLLTWDILIYLGKGDFYGQWVFLWWNIPEKYRDFYERRAGENKKFESGDSSRINKIFPMCLPGTHRVCAFRPYYKPDECTCHAMEFYYKEIRPIIEKKIGSKWYTCSSEIIKFLFYLSNIPSVSSLDELLPKFFELWTSFAWIGLIPWV